MKTTANTKGLVIAIALPSTYFCKQIYKASVSSAHDIIFRPKKKLMISYMYVRNKANWLAIARSSNEIYLDVYIEGELDNDSSHN